MFLIRKRDDTALPARFDLAIAVSQHDRLMLEHSRLAGPRCFFLLPFFHKRSNMYYRDREIRTRPHRDSAYIIPPRDGRIWPTNMAPLTGCSMNLRL